MNKSHSSKILLPFASNLYIYACHKADARKEVNYKHDQFHMNATKAGGKEVPLVVFLY